MPWDGIIGGGASAAGGGNGGDGNRRGGSRGDGNDVVDRFMGCCCSIQGAIDA